MPEAVDEITPDIMARYDGLYVNSPRVTAASVARADLRVKIVARHGVGYDSVDVPALAARGVIATNTPVAVRRPVAVAALTFIFALAGRLLQKDRLIRSGRWHERTHWMGQGLTTRTLGVIGAGGIGRELLALARPFGWRMLAADPHVDAAVVQALGAELLPLPQLLQQADFVVATLLLNDATRHLMNAQRFAQMKRSAYFINLSRGPIADEVALIAALRDGTIAGAALDVFEQEPVVARQPSAGDGQRAADAACAVLDRRMLRCHCARRPGLRRRHGPRPRAEVGDCRARRRVSLRCAAPKACAQDRRSVGACQAAAGSPGLRSTRSMRSAGSRLR